MRQSRPAAGLGFQVQLLETFQVAPSWLGSGGGGPGHLSRLVKRHLDRDDEPGDGGKRQEARTREGVDHESEGLVPARIQILANNLWFRGGLVFEANRLLYHSA